MLDAAVLAVGGRAHELQGLIARAFLQRDPGRNRKNLFFRAVGPIGLVGLLERGAKRLDGLDLRFRAGEIAGARHSETACETGQRISLRVLARREWERRGAGPIGAFEHITRRHGVLGREVDEGDGAIAAVRRGERFVGQRLGLGVLRKLQVRVNREIRRVIVVGLDLDRRSVRRDRFLPQPDHRVDVRRHVPGVRHRRRDAGIAPRGGDALFGERWKS